VLSGPVSSSGLGSLSVVQDPLERSSSVSLSLALYSALMTFQGYGFMGAVVICVMGCLAELSALAPLSGAYVRHSEYFVDPALSFAIGWIAVYGPCVSVPSEWVAVSVIVQYWTDINGGVWIAICIGEYLHSSIPTLQFKATRNRLLTTYPVLAFATNIFLIRIFGEVELICAMLKIMLILGLILFGLIFDLGGVPNQHRLGFQYWRNPGAFGEGYLVTGATGRFASSGLKGPRCIC